VLDGPTLIAMQRLVRRMPIGDKLVDLILRLVRAGRPENRELPDIAEQVGWGPGPRASQALMLAVRVRALLDGRLAPSPEDVLALAGPVLRHRMAVTFAARAQGSPSTTWWPALPARGLRRDAWWTRSGPRARSKLKASPASKRKVSPRPSAISGWPALGATSMS
jgi:MoxR-like ATPase